MLAGSLALALALYAAPVQAQDDTDQSQEQPVQGTIETLHLDGPSTGFVTYRWFRSDRTHKDGQLQESAAGGKTVSTSWDQTSTAKGWMQLIVLTPKHVETPRSYFWVHCGTS